MAEFEELTLEVKLVDNASPQIDLIKRNIKELSGAKSDIAGLKTETAAFGEQLKRLTDTVAKGPEAWLKFAASFGAVGIAVEAVGHSMFSLSHEMKRFGDEMLKIDVVAKRAGTDPGTVQNFIEVARTAGISAETVNRELIQMRQNIGGNIEGLTAMAQRIAFLPGGSEIFRKLQENLRSTHIAEDQAMLIKRAVDEYVEIVAKSAGSAEAAKARDALSKIYGPEEIILKFPSQMQPISKIRKDIAEREVAASKEVVRLQGDIINNFNQIFGMLKVNLMEDTLFGQGLKAMAAILKMMANDMRNRRIAPQAPGQQFPKGGPMEGEVLKPGPEGFRQQQEWFRRKRLQQQQQEQQGQQGQQGQPQDQSSIWQRGWGHLKDYFGGRTRGGATEPQRLMGGEGVSGFTGEYPGMTPESWKNAADWAEQLHGDPSTNIERRDLISNQNDETKKLIEQIRRTNALLSGEEEPTAPLGLLSTKMGGLRAGLGGGIGTGYGAVTGGGTPGGSTPSGTTGTPGVGGGPFPSGTHGGPGGPPITPTAPGGTIPATLPGSVAPLGYPAGAGFTPVPDLTTYTGQPRPGAGGATTTTGKVSGDTDKAITDAAAQYGIDPNFFRSIADIESSSNPQSNRNRDTQYKGLFQINQSQLKSYGGGDIYNARDNANAAAKIFAENRDWFVNKYNRQPTDGELYMMHLQGRGFFTSGTLTNVAGNPYPGMRGPQTPQSFLAGWSARVERGKQQAIARSGATAITTETAATPPTLTTPKVAVTTPQITPEMFAGPTQLPQSSTAAARGPGAIIEAQGKDAAVRKGAISPELRAALQYASAQTGLTVRVASGGQRMEGARGATGSHRHDSGDAADFDLIDKNGNKVAIDDPRYLEFVTHAARAGVKGGGAAESYMGRYRAHLDVVGAERGGAPGIYIGSKAFREAYERGATSRLTPEQLAEALKEPTSRVAGPGVPTGTTGPHITNLPVRVTTGEPETEWQMRGGDFGARARRARGVFRARDEEEPDRSMLDRAGAGGLMRRRLLGTGKIDVTVKSKGQESVEQKGPFKPVRWHRHTQMQEASHGPENPKEMTGGEGPGAGPG
jgi:hypothetical protein